MFYNLAVNLWIYTQILESGRYVGMYQNKLIAKWWLIWKLLLQDATVDDNIKSAYFVYLVLNVVLLPGSAFSVPFTRGKRGAWYSLLPLTAILSTHGCFMTVPRCGCYRELPAVIHAIAVVRCCLSVTTKLFWHRVYSGADFSSWNLICTH